MKIWLLFSILFLSFEALSASSDSFKDCGVSGSVTIYDQKNNKWIETDSGDAQIRSLPASTFKIFNSLIALDQKATDLKEIFIWDKVVREISQWNQNSTLKEAFENSTVWVYEVIAKRIKPKDYLRYLKWSNYGNHEISTGKDGNFWVYGKFGVSPKEQIELLKALYRNELPFSRESMDLVKSFMKDKKDNATFGKTGWTSENNKHLGWWVGWQMKDNSPIFFATRIWRDKNLPLGDFVACRKSITAVSLSRLK